MGNRNPDAARKDRCLFLPRLAVCLFLLPETSAARTTTQLVKVAYLLLCTLDCDATPHVTSPSPFISHGRAIHPVPPARGTPTVQELIQRRFPFLSVCPFQFLPRAC